MTILGWVEDGIIAGVVAVGAAWGTVRTTLYYHSKRVDKMEQDTNKRMDGLKEDSEKQFSKLEAAMTALAEAQRKCLEGCFSSRQKSLAMSIWNYLRTEDGVDNFLRISVYEKNHTILEDKVDALSEKIDDNMNQRNAHDDKMSEKMDRILEKVSG